MRTWIAVLCVFFAGHAYAVAAEWHWETFGASGYSGQISLADDQGSALNYQRYDAAGSPSLFGSASVQSPITVIAGADIQIDIVRSGVQQNKKVCNGASVWKVYVTPATACNSGSGTNIGGIHAWAVSDSATRYTPRLSVYVQGYGWRQITNNSCGNVQTQQLCE